MGRKSKIKRGYSIFKKNRRPGKLALRITFIAVGAVALVFLAVAAYGPLFDYFSGNLVSSDSSQESSQPSEPEDSSSSSSSVASSNSSSASEEPPPAEPQQFEGLKAATLPFAYCLEADSLEQYLAGIAADGFNAVVIEAKDDTGYLYYKTNNAQAAEAGAVLENAVDMHTLVETAAAHGLSVYASIYAFEDHLASGLGLEWAIQYTGGGIYWVDDYVENGGQKWLNPYSTPAQEYILSIVDELTAQGVAGVLLNGVYFPTVSGVYYAYYGPEAETTSQAELLASFLTRAKETAAVNGAETCLTVSAAAALGNQVEAYSVNPLTFGMDYVLIDMRVDQIQSIVTDDGVIESPMRVPGQSVGILLQDIQTSMAGNTRLLCLLQAAPGESGMTAEAFLREQTDAVAAGEAAGYYAYSAAGDY